MQVCKGLLFFYEGKKNRNFTIKTSLTSLVVVAGFPLRVCFL